MHFTALNLLYFLAHLYHTLVTIIYHFPLSLPFPTKHYKIDGMCFTDQKIKVGPPRTVLLCEGFPRPI